MNKQINYVYVYGSPLEKFTGLDTPIANEMGLLLKHAPDAGSTVRHVNLDQWRFVIKCITISY